MIEDHWDDYLIPGTDILKNKLNIINKKELAETEKSKTLGCGPLDLDYTKMDSNNLLLGTAERYVFPSMLEVEFMKALVPVEKEKNHQI